MTAMRFTLSDEQRRIVLTTLRQQGTFSLAAHNAGLSPTALRGAMANDEFLAEEVGDAIDLFKDAIRLTVLERATVGKSDAMLKLAAEAFVPESFKQATVDSKSKTRPSVLMVRSFDDNGNEVNHTVGANSTPPPDAAPAAPSPADAPRPNVRLIDFEDEDEPGSGDRPPEMPPMPPPPLTPKPKPDPLQIDYLHDTL